MKLLLLALLLPVLAYSRHYPEERTYNLEDKGHTQYGAPSLHGKSMYSLTFDDGPHPVRTPKILDLLKKYKVRATFFTVTSQITPSSFPIVKRILDEGHILASHGRFHDNSNNITKEEWKERVKQSFVDLAKWYKKAGHDFNKFYYRFPYAAYGLRRDHHHMNTLKEISQELMQDNCIHFTFWDIDSGDWIPGMTAQEVSANIRANEDGGKFITYKTVRLNGKLTQIKVAKDIEEPLRGGVVLQHDIQEGSIAGTELFLKYAQERGIKIVPLDEVEEFAITKHCQL
jgi:peptidoglycan/xylan/chitin deacetylase (PgdA/CDA1 family)